MFYRLLGYPPSDTLVQIQIYLSPYYAAEIDAAASQITDPELKAKALKVKNIPTFIWFDVVRKVPDLATYLADAQAKQKSTGKKYLVQIVVYDLPDRDCAAKSSNGEFSLDNDGLNKYYNYIDQLVAIIKSLFSPWFSFKTNSNPFNSSEYPDVRVVAAVEPDSLANLVTNLSVPKCAGAQQAYKSGVIYAMKQLSSVGVYSYVDGGHAGWLGWPANLGPAAKLYAQLWKDAGSPKLVRGVATDVSNYNALRMWQKLVLTSVSHHLCSS
jgi:cellulose 1,4-beta-cellobiosidase